MLHLACLCCYCQPSVGALCLDLSQHLLPLHRYCGSNIMHDYQRERVLTFLNPEAKPLDEGYHIIQSKIAIGSGGMEGKGWLNGTQSLLQFLPERTTDFIFAVYSEEFGLLGILVLLSLYFFIISRGMYIALQAQDTFSRLLVGSLVLTFFVYIFVNMGMVTGILPVVGLPLPLISYGGTSIITLMAGFGLIMGGTYPSTLLVFLMIYWMEGNHKLIGWDTSLLDGG
ncbi:Rod shape-determining protein rodA [Beggiatoa sp. SS]|nr:Rod shape-determining protein rodA [Beggiatoa sp. SS]